MPMSGEVLIEGMVVVLLLLPLLPLASSTTPLAQQTPESQAGLGCSNEVVAFSPCLNYVSSSQNNRSSEPSMQCCRILSSVFQRHDAACLCYLVRRPLISSFSINTTRLYSLSSLCHQMNVGSDARISLESLCLGKRSHHRHPSHPPTTVNSSEGTSDAPSLSSGPMTESPKSSAMEKLIPLRSLELGEFLIPLAATLIMNR